MLKYFKFGLMVFYWKKEAEVFLHLGSILKILFTMKMMCINDRGWETKGMLYPILKNWVETNGPSYGDFVTVTGQEYEDGILHYILLEWPNDNFQADCFIPCSEIDEMELAEQRLETA